MQDPLRKEIKMPDLNKMNRDQLRELEPETEAMEQAIDQALRCVCTSCGKPGGFERSDRYGIYAGRLCDPCWNVSGARTWVFDAAYAGESLEEDY
jgi:hypothetical protein